MENSTVIFNIALGLSNPWQVVKVEFVEVSTKRELHIHLGFKRGVNLKALMNRNIQTLVLF